MPKLTNFRCRIKFATRNHRAALLAHPITVTKPLPTSMTPVATKMDNMHKIVTKIAGKRNCILIDIYF